MLNKNEIMLELEDTYYNMYDLLDALIEHYKNKGIKCEKLYEDKLVILYY